MSHPSETGAGPPDAAPDPSRPAPLTPATAPVPSPREQVALVAATILAHLPVLVAGFLWDDGLWLWDSPLTTSADGWWRAWTAGERFDWYPLTSNVFWLAWRLFGEAPFGYHALNLLLHALGALVLLRVLRALRVPGAWLGAAVWAVHPVNVATVAWIAELKNTLSFPLHAGAALVWIEAWDRPSARRRAGAVGLHASSLLAKAAGVMLPVGLVALAWVRGRPLRRELKALAPMFAVSLIAGLLTWRFQAEGAIGSAVPRSAGLAARVATAGQSLAFYLEKALLPRDLAIVYPRETADPSRAAAWLPLAALVILLAALLAGRRRLGAAPAAALAGWFFALLPVLGFVETYYARWSPVADHWHYHALPWILAPLAAGVTQAFRSWPLPAARRAVLALWPVALGLGAFAQARAYRDPGTFWTKVLSHDPGSPLAHAELGVQLAREGDLAAAESHLREAMVVNPVDGFAPNNLGRVLERAGRVDEAAEAYRTAIEREPRLVSARANLGRALAALGDTDGAIAEFRAAADADPRFAEPRYNLALAFLRQGMEDSAAVRLGEVIRLAPDFRDAHRELARLLVRRGDLAGAAARMRDVLRIDPEDAEAKAVLEAIERAAAAPPPTEAPPEEAPPPAAPPR